MNYIVTYDGESQVYGSGSKDIALQTPPPTGVSLESKHVYFITQDPQNGDVMVHEVPREEVMQADIKVKTKKADVQ